MEFIAFIMFVMLGADIYCSGFLRDKGHFLKAHKLKDIGEQVLLPMLLVCAVILTMQTIIK